MENITIDGIPSLVWGEHSDKVFIAVHGKMSCKENFEVFAGAVGRRGYQVLSFDLPEHGERKGESDTCNPWNGVCDLQTIFRYAECRWTDISLYAESLGAYFCLLAFPKEAIRQCLFVSPVLDMERLVQNMMAMADVDEAILQARQKIPTDFGETLSWTYYSYVREHPVQRWGIPTAILYGGHDALIGRDIVEDFASRFNCQLTVADDAEHWFHTPDQRKALSDWLDQTIR
jgi:alpha-beta hydrolase superfamily lysophospholipase